MPEHEETLPPDAATAADHRNPRRRNNGASNGDAPDLGVIVTGLDGLQHAASDVAFLEFPWTPAGLEQAGSRLHRMGQPGTVHEWHLIAPGTVDDELLGILAAKAKVCNAANDGIAARRNAAIEIARAVARRLRS